MNGGDGIYGLARLVGARRIPRRELRHTDRGQPFHAWTWDMPRIDDQLLDCAIYLYPSVAAAREGERAGGSGFLVMIKSERVPGHFHRYAVTNKHVIYNARTGAPASSVVRFNTRRGGSDVLDLRAGDWMLHPEGDDLAVAALPPLNWIYLKYQLLPERLFLTEEMVRQLEIGIGDETFVVGRSVGHDGLQRNHPSVRFGNISQMPGEPVRTEWGHDQAGFVVETRSLSGWSGSPVFVHFLPGAPRPSDAPGSVTVGDPTGPWLLGVDFGHLPIYEPVMKKNDRGNYEPVEGGQAVQSNSGRMLVIPAWRLLQLLNQDVFVEQRALGDIAEMERRAASTVILDSPPPSQ